MTTPTPPVARLSRPSEIVAAIPMTLGFTPSESLVLACLHEPRGRLGLTLRIDLPSPGQEDALIADLEWRIRADRATRVLVIVYTEQPDRGELVRSSLVAALAHRSPCPVVDALLVRGGRFWSYLCDDPVCCPEQGTLIDPTEESDGLGLLAAERVLEGRGLLPSRAALAASLQGPAYVVDAEANEAADVRAYTDAAEALAQVVADLGVEPARQAALLRWDGALRAWSEGDAALSRQDAADLVVSLTDTTVRDLLAAVEPDDASVLCSLLAALCRRAPDAWAAPVCTLYGWVTYCQGAGAAVTIALERAVACDPDYALAGLLLALLDQQVSPTEIRRLTEVAAAVLQERDLPAAG